MRKYILLAAVLLVAAVAAGFFDGAKITVPVVSPQVALAVNDPGMEGAGGGCPGHSAWFVSENLFGEQYWAEEWVRDC